MTNQIFTPLAAAFFGLGLLAALLLQPQPGSADQGLLFPPWVSRADAFQRAATLGVPITDIRLGGRLVVLRIPPGTDTVTLPGTLRIGTGNTVTCIAIRPAQEPVS